MATDQTSMTKAERKALRKAEKAELKAASMNQQLKQRLIKFGVVGAIVLVIGYLIYNSYVPIPQADKNKPVDAFIADDWLLGPKTAPVKVIEYSDFQCPSCKQANLFMAAVMKTYNTQMALSYRHFPLRDLHPNAQLAAQAAEAAGKQGKFWEMHDLLFANQESWADTGSARSTFIGFAQQLGLNVSQFTQDLNSKAVRGRVESDYQSAIERSLNATPSFFVNGEAVSTAQGFEALGQAIDAAVQQATASAKAK